MLLLTSVSAALRGRAAVRARGFGLAGVADPITAGPAPGAGGIGTGWTAGFGVWSRIGARDAEADERKRGSAERWRNVAAAAAHPGQLGVGGRVRRGTAALYVARSMLVDARRDMFAWYRDERVAPPADSRDGSPRRERKATTNPIQSDWPLGLAHGQR